MFPYLPFSTPRYLTDQIFVNAGFFTGTSSALQRTMAYVVAENQVEQHLQTFLQPTVFTGTMTSVILGKPIYAPVTRLISIPQVRFFQKLQDGTDRILSGTARILDPESGIFYVDFSPYDTSYEYYRLGGLPVVTDGSLYAAEITYNAGYQTGTAGNPEIQIAMTLAADMILKLLYDPGANENPNLAFIKSFQSGRYLEAVSDKFLLDTVFGQSQKAQMIRSLLKRYVIHRSGMLGR